MNMVPAWLFLLIVLVLLVAIIWTARKKFPIIKSLIDFLMSRKKYWIIPLVIMLLMLGLLIVFASSSALAPLIYPLF
jgi:hypothetical protein